MICPKCGATLEEYGKCWVCGNMVTEESIRASKASAKKPAPRKPATRPTYDDFSDLEDDEPIVTAKVPESPKKKVASKAPQKKNTKKKFSEVYDTTKIIKFCAFSITAIAFIIVAFFVIKNVINKLDKGYEKVVDTMYTSMQEVDADKMIGLYDKGILTEDKKNDIKTEYNVLAMVSEMDMKITYKLDSAQRLSKKKIQDYFKDFADEKYVKKISVAVLCETSYTTKVSFGGQTEEYTETQSLIAYKRKGHWYLGPVLPNAPEQK